MNNEVAAVHGSAAFQAARARIAATDDLTLAHMCEATVIPAPTGHERERGRWLFDRFFELGINPYIDEVGNVVAATPDSDPNAPRIVVAAHLDTAFPENADVSCTRAGMRIEGPGISDNARGLAGMLALARGLQAATWPTRTPVVFVGTVGEEGAGDLRGVKYYVAQHSGRIAAFIALDGAGASRIITTGVGSRRLRITLDGPGGHSWSDWGTPNALHTAGRSIAALASLRLPFHPRTTLSVGRAGGGSSINVIAAHAWFELDLRSEESGPLHELERTVRATVQRICVEDLNARGSVTCTFDVIGDRPAGQTAADAPLVRVALDATRVAGFTPELTSSSTDANVPMAAGIPAIAIGAGGDAGGTHTLREWYVNERGVSGLERALLILLTAAGLRG